MLKPGLTSTYQASWCRPKNQSTSLPDASEKMVFSLVIIPDSLLF